MARKVTCANHIYSSTMQVMASPTSPSAADKQRQGAANDATAIAVHGASTRNYPADRQTRHAGGAGSAVTSVIDLRGSGSVARKSIIAVANEPLATRSVLRCKQATLLTTPAGSQLLQCSVWPRQLGCSVPLPSRPRGTRWFMSLACAVW